jgi:hypothetical protein
VNPYIDIICETNEEEEDIEIEEEEELEEVKV